MLIKAEQLPAQLDRELAALYVLYGDEPLLVMEAADLIRKAAKTKGFSEKRVLTVLPHFDWGELALAAGNLSIFGDRTLIDLRIPNGKPGRDGGAALQKWTDHPAPDCVLLITLPELDWREEKSVWFSALVKAGVVIKLMAPVLRDLPAWLAGRLRRQQQSAEMPALQFIAERVEGNLLAAHQEIQKLGLLYPQKMLTLAEVRSAVCNVARYDIDALREALLGGDLGRLARTLDGLQQEGEAPPLVLWAFSEEIRALYGLKHGLESGASIDSLYRQFNIWGLRQAAIKPLLGRLSLNQLRKALEKLGDIDRLIKGVGKGNVWENFLGLGLLLHRG